MGPFEAQLKVGALRGPSSGRALKGEAGGRWVNALLMYAALVKRSLFRVADIKAAPNLTRILPVLRRGASLQVNPFQHHLMYGSGLSQIGSLRRTGVPPGLAGDCAMITAVLVLLSTQPAWASLLTWRAHWQGRSAKCMPACGHVFVRVRVWGACLSVGAWMGGWGVIGRICGGSLAAEQPGRGRVLKVPLYLLSWRGVAQARSLSIWFVMLNATMVAMRCGTAAMAAHEVLRSCWSFCMYAFWALNASSQVRARPFLLECPGLAQPCAGMLRCLGPVPVWEVLQ